MVNTIVHAKNKNSTTIQASVWSWPRSNRIVHRNSKTHLLLLIHSSRRKDMCFLRNYLKLNLPKSAQQSWTSSSTLSNSTDDIWVWAIKVLKYSLLTIRQATAKQAVRSRRALWNLQWRSKSTMKTHPLWKEFAAHQNVVQQRKADQEEDVPKLP